MSHHIEVVERYLVPDLPPIDLPCEDGVPLETDWHRIQINLLADNVRELWSGRTDFFVGGNMTGVETQRIRAEAAERENAHLREQLQRLQGGGSGNG